MEHDLSHTDQSRLMFAMLADLDADALIAAQVAGDNAALRLLSQLEEAEQEEIFRMTAEDPDFYSV